MFVLGFMAWFFPLDFDFVPVFFSTRVLTRDERQIPVYLGQPEQQKLIKKRNKLICISLVVKKNKAGK